MLSLGDGTMEVTEYSPPGHSIAHALPKTAKHPQFHDNKLLYRQTPDRVSAETCCTELQIKRSPPVSLTQKPVLPLSDAAASAIESIHPLPHISRFKTPMATGF